MMTNPHLLVNIFFILGLFLSLAYPYYRFVSEDTTSHADAGPELFFRLGPREFCQTQWFVELSLKMAVGNSYRDTADLLDRVRGQQARFTSVTMGDRIVERDGTAIQTTQEQGTREILANTA